MRTVHRPARSPGRAHVKLLVLTTQAVWPMIEVEILAMLRCVTCLELRVF